MPTTSPPRSTRTPQARSSASSRASRSAAQALVVDPRSSRQSGGTRTVAARESISILRQSGAGRGSSKDGRSRTTRGRAEGDDPVTRVNVRSYPASHNAWPTVGVTSPSVTSAPSTAAARAARRTGPTRTASPFDRLTADSSESSRNRLHARSTTSSHSRVLASASRATEGSVTTTRTRVLQARRSIAAGAAGRVMVFICLAASLIRNRPRTPTAWASAAAAAWAPA